jgi:NADH-quinone oxidoreductase subunit J
MTDQIVFFYAVSFAVIVPALGLLFTEDLMKALICLVTSMFSVGVLFIGQEAYFLGGVQFAVYAGAVMVLFLMVLMIMGKQIQTNEHKRLYESPSLGKFIKMAAVGVFLGLSLGALSIKSYSNTFGSGGESENWTKEISKKIFLENIFAFEIIGILLLVIAVGVVTVKKSEDEK